MSNLVDNLEESDFSDDDFEDEEDEIENFPVKGLFSDKIYKSVVDMFRSEYKQNNFNLFQLINKYNMNQIDYIKMINFIRAQNPPAQAFNVEYNNELPWNCDVFMKTVVEDDPALQFDIEEDLDLLDSIFEINNSNQKDSNEMETIIKKYEREIKNKNSKIEELVDMVEKFRNIASNLLNNKSRKSSQSSDSELNDDYTYAHSYSNYSIHLEMLHDKIRTESYMSGILDNKQLFKDKVVLDVGCGSGILSLFAAKAGAKQVIAIDMSEILNKAIIIAKENNYEGKIVFLKGKMEEINLPVDKVDIIISEWMGYFLLFESMLDSVLFARDKYLNKETGIVLPNFFEMHLFGVSDLNTYDRTIGFWSDVYGFKMNTMKKTVCSDAQIQKIDSKNVVSNLVRFKEINCMEVTTKDINEFYTNFEIQINKDCNLTGIGASFDTFFSHSSLTSKISFSTSPFHKETHWQQTLFQFDEPISVRNNQKISGNIKCFKNPNHSRSYCVELRILDRFYSYKVE